LLVSFTVIRLFDFWLFGYLVSWLVSWLVGWWVSWLITVQYKQEPDITIVTTKGAETEKTPFFFNGHFACLEIIFLFLN
jgi:hypothetical protein